MPALSTTYTVYQSNVDTDIVAAQATVFAHLGIPLVQELDDRTNHATWLTKIMRDDSLGELAGVADIDAFPLSLAGYERLNGLARAGNVSGLAQVAYHKDPDHIYAGPMFLSLRAEEDGVPLALIYPKFCIAPRWSLAQYGVLGIGTFYGENEFFHLFDLRRQQSKDLFLSVAECVLRGRDNFDRFLTILDVVAPKRKKLGLH